MSLCFQQYDIKTNGFYVDPESCHYLIQDVQTAAEVSARPAARPGSVTNVTCFYFEAAAPGPRVTAP